VSKTCKLSTLDAVVIIVGLVVGSGIFKTPSVVAAQSSRPTSLLLFWLVGGTVTLAGALCYAELSSADPDPGGDYQFLGRAYGPRVAFLFGWSRLAVLQTGSIALLAFVFGDYADRVFPLGLYGSALWGAGLILGVTAVQLSGLRQGTALQKLLTSAQIVGLVSLVFGAWAWEGTSVGSLPPSAQEPTSPGLALVFVMLTFGGWSEAAYLSADVRTPTRFVKALLLGVALVTILYLLLNWACLSVLGLQAMAESQAVLADLGEAVGGSVGLGGVAVLVALSAATSTNATMLTGARGIYALGRDFESLNFLGGWDDESAVPRQALLAQAGVALALVAFGATTRSGFKSMVEYTAPVFWLFILLVGASLFKIRRSGAQAEPPFSVPLYPFTPLLFCGGSAFMLWSSLVYTGTGALLGVAVLGAGIPLLYFSKLKPKRSFQKMEENR
jgi:amino acid transporter